MLLFVVVVAAAAVFCLFVSTSPECLKHTMKVNLTQEGKWSRPEILFTYGAPSEQVIYSILFHFLSAHTSHVLLSIW